MPLKKNSKRKICLIVGYADKEQSELVSLEEKACARARDHFLSAGYLEVHTGCASRDVKENEDRIFRVASDPQMEFITLALEVGRDSHSVGSSIKQHHYYVNPLVGDLEIHHHKPVFLYRSVAQVAREKIDSNLDRLFLAALDAYIHHND